MHLNDPLFQDPQLAREWLEANRWPDGPICPHCGNADASKITALKGKAHRPGLYKCNECLEQFTVTVGTVMERSKIPLNKWVMAMFLMAASKKGISAHQMHRMMQVPYKTAWFLMHRIREAMRDNTLRPLGGDGMIVEADETYFGHQDDPQPSASRKGRPYTQGGTHGPAGKRAIVTLVERGGSARSFHVETANEATVTKIVSENLASETVLYTDESKLYGDASELFEHDSVKHSGGEYVRGNVHTNTVENYFSVFKRGMRGVYQHCGEKHLHRYLAEFDFRYNSRSALGFTDTERAQKIAREASGKRLMYQRPRAITGN